MHFIEISPTICIFVQIKFPFMKRLSGIIICLLLYNFAAAQNSDSLHVKISLLTCAPGEDLYTSFGHTAIRIIDSMAHTDVVFNYGVFNFDEPDFYMKFTRGKLNYMIGADAYDDFIQ